MSRFTAKFRQWIDFKTFILSFSISAIWILTSDYLVHHLLGHFIDIQTLQSIKGLFYITVFSLILGMYQQRQKRAQQSLFYKDKLMTLGELSATIVHEINNPLQVIGLGLDKLLIQYPGDHRMSEIVANMEVSLDRLKGTIEVLNRLGRNESVDDFVKVDLGKIIEDVKEFLHHRFARLRVPFEIRGLKESELIVNGHPGLLTHMFLNLLSNALDAVSTQAEGQTWIRVQIAKLENGLFQIVVENSGKPIPKHILENLFEPFFTTKERGKGTGIGLSLCRRIVQIHHGKLWYNAGSAHPCFVVELPSNM